MATKPTTLPRWAEDTGGNQVNISTPPSGKQDVGWLTAEKPPSQWFNYLFNLIYRWCAYLRDGIFVGEAGEPGITVTGGSGDEIGAVVTGSGAGVGATITGGATGGGATITAGGGNNNGLTVTGSGTEKAILATGGGSSGTAVRAIAGAPNGSAVDASASGTGVTLFAESTGAGDAMEADASAGSGNALVVTGNASAPAVTVAAGAGQNAAQLTGGAGAAGATVANGTAATGGTRQDALTLTNGDLNLSGVTAPTSTTAITNRLTPANLVKAYASITTTGATFAGTVDGGFNVASATRTDATHLRVTFGAAMANTNYVVLAINQSVAKFVIASTRNASYVELVACDADGVPDTIDGNTWVWTVMVIGAQ